MRRKIIAGNWKMNKTAEEAVQLASAVAQLVTSEPHHQVDTIIAPPFPFISDCFRAGQPAGFYVAAQNCSSEKSGAFTGEVSAAMIASTGAKYVIIGHSERRALFHESDEMLYGKIHEALNAGIIPIFCVGETLAERQDHRELTIIQEQFEHTICKLSYNQMDKVVIAYEPVWAIGTGLTASPEQAQDMHVAIRNILSSQFGHAKAEQTPILYGGSCNPSNAKALFSCADVDGGLIGGASLNIGDFTAIRKAMLEVLA